MHLTRLDFFQSKNALEAYLLTLRCELLRWMRNSHRVMCNYCGWTGNEFFPHNTTSRNVMGEVCPWCCSIPRYRILLDFLKNELRFFDQQAKILDVGPNRSLQKLCLENQKFDYISVDIKSPQALKHMDVTDLKFEDACFDVVLCISVLQYVEKDRKAMQELYRVLKPDGYVIIASGIDERRVKTIEYDRPNPAQCYTVRMYGRDIVEKLERVGFNVRKFDHAHQLSEEYKERFGLSDHMIYYLTKQRLD